MTAYKNKLTVQRKSAPAAFCGRRIRTKANHTPPYVNCPLLRGRRVAVLNCVYRSAIASCVVYCCYQYISTAILALSVLCFIAAVALVAPESHDIKRKHTGQCWTLLSCYAAILANCLPNNYISCTSSLFTHNNKAYSSCEATDFSLSCAFT